MAGIPLSWNDPLLSGVTSSGSVMLRNGGTLSYKSIVDNSGDPSVTTVGGGSFTIDHVRIDSREGIRIAGGGDITISNSYIETAGIGDDHADGIQAYAPGSTGNVTITNTTIVNPDNTAELGCSLQMITVGHLLSITWCSRVVRLVCVLPRMRTISRLPQRRVFCGTIYV